MTTKLDSKKCRSKGTYNAYEQYLLLNAAVVRCLVRTGFITEFVAKAYYTYLANRFSSELPECCVEPDIKRYYDIRHLDATHYVNKLKDIYNTVGEDAVMWYSGKEICKSFADAKINYGVLKKYETAVFCTYK